MDRSGTDGRAGTGQPCRALVASPQPVRWPNHGTGGRPMAGFLTQMLVEAEPGLRPARLERTRAAAQVYARTAGLLRRP